MSSPLNIHHLFNWKYSFLVFCCTFPSVGCRATGLWLIGHVCVLLYHVSLHIGNRVFWEGQIFNLYWSSQETAPVWLQTCRPLSCMFSADGTMSISTTIQQQHAKFSILQAPIIPLCSCTSANGWHAVMLRERLSSVCSSSWNTQPNPRQPRFTIMRSSGNMLTMPRYGKAAVNWWTFAMCHEYHRRLQNCPQGLGMCFPSFILHTWWE